jgi:hypothetical protein
MDWFQAKDAILTGLAGLFVLYLSSQIKVLVESINTLNIKIAEILTRMEMHKETLDEHGTRIVNLEQGDSTNGKSKKRSRSCEGS